MSMHYLITGGAGFVGSNLVRRLLADGDAHITVVDNLLSSERDNLPESPQIEFIEGSITDDRILARLDDRFDYVFHLATYHGNQSSMHDPLADHENNTLTTLKLLEQIKGFGRIRKVVYSSAGCTVAEKTFDEAEATSEDAPVSLYLDSPYQISKIIGELYGNYYHAQHGVPFVKARFQNVYGPGEVLGAGRWRGTPATVWRNVVPTFVFRAILNRPLYVENEHASRDFIYVEDVVDGLIRCAERGAPGDVFNLASGRETTISELARAIVRLAESQSEIKIGEQRKWDHSGKRFGSTTKAQQQLAFVARLHLQDGLRNTIEWQRENRSRIDACIRRHKQHMPDLD